MEEVAVEVAVEEVVTVDQEPVAVQEVAVE